MKSAIIIVSAAVLLLVISWICWPRTALESASPGGKYSARVLVTTSFPTIWHTDIEVVLTNNTNSQEPTVLRRAAEDFGGDTHTPVLLLWQADGQRLLYISQINYSFVMTNGYEIGPNNQVREIEVSDWVRPIFERELANSQGERKRRLVAVIENLRASGPITLQKTLRGLETQ